VGLNWAQLEEETDNFGSLSASGAALPSWKKSQAQGIEAFGDILDWDLPEVTEFRQGQDDILKGFRSRFPEGLFKTEDKLGWWEEKATLNSMNQIVPYLGYTASAILGVIPHPATQIVSKLVGGLTFATQYNANFADTLQEHEERAGRPLDAQEKAWAGVVSGLVVALDRLVPGRLAKDTVNKFGGMKGVMGSRKAIEKALNQTKQKLNQSLFKGAKYVGKRTGTEFATEAAQKVLQIGSSQDPSYLTTPEGFESVVEEGAVAGPTAGILSTPTSVLEATAHNREIAQAGRAAKRFNQMQKQAKADIFDETGISEEVNPIVIPETSTGIIKKGTDKIKKATGFDLETLGSKFGDIAAFRPSTELVRARNRQTRGKEFSLFNQIVQKFIPVGSFSGEKGLEGGQNFFQRRDQYHGQLYKDINEIFNRIAPTKRGQLTPPRLSEEQNDYLNEMMENRSRIKKNERPDLISQDDLINISTGLDKAGFLLQEHTGSNFAENYLRNPISREKVTANKEGFVNVLIASSKAAYFKSKAKDKSAMVYQPNDVAGTLQRAQAIAEEIIQGRDPFTTTSKQLRELLKFNRRGKGKEGFEKNRSLEWQGVTNDFRERDATKVIEQYMSQVATRVASAQTFGNDNANKLQKLLEELETSDDKDNRITQHEIDRIWDMYDAVHGVYRRDVSPGEQQWRLASKALTTVGAITHLGFATISSLPELVWIAERTGFVNMLSTIGPAFKYTRQGVKQGLSGNKLEYTEGNRVLANLGFNLNPAMNERLDQLFATDRNAILSMYFRSPFGAFLTQWTNFNRNWAALSGMAMMNRRAKGLVNDSIDPTDRQRMMNELKETGITLDEFKTLAELSKDEKGNININMLDDNYLNKKMTRSNGTITDVRSVLHPYVHKIVNDIVINPVATNKPLWMSDPSLATIAQLKTFPIVFGNTVMKRILRKLNPNQCSPDYGLAVSAIGAMAAAMAVAYTGEQIKQAIRGQDRDVTWVDLGNTAGLFGPYGMLAGGKYGDFSTTLMGPALDALINKSYSEFILPFLDEDGGGIAEANENLWDWSKSALISSAGVTGELLVGEEE